MEMTDRDRACEDMKRALERIADEQRAMCLAMGPSATYELEMLRLAEHMWWRVHDYEVEGRR